MKNRDLLFVILILLSLVFAWLVGFYRDQADLTGVLGQVLPAAGRFERRTDDVFVGYARAGEVRPKVGYVSIAEASGFGGPIRVAVGLDNEGRITQIAILRQTEALHYLRRIIERGLPGALAGRSWSGDFRIGGDIDAVTGATASLEGLTGAIREACHRAARLEGVALTLAPERKVSFGLPEMVLILVYGVGYLAYQRSDTLGRLLRMATLAVGLGAIGFWLNGSMSLIHINRFLLGYWPAWRDHLYWYLLIGGVLLPILLTGKSLYCSHVCPFGAVQQALGAAGMNRKVPKQWDACLRWLQRGLVWVAIVCALAFRNPALIPYDLSGALFGWAGLTWQFVALVAILIVSLVITRPWCNYLCPIRAVTDFIRLIRRAVARR